MTPVGYLSRGVAFAILGVLVGVFVDRSRSTAADDLRAQHEVESQFADTAQWLEEEVAERTRELLDARAETLQRLAVAAEFHDDETAQHTRPQARSAEAWRDRRAARSSLQLASQTPRSPAAAQRARR